MQNFPLEFLRTQRQLYMTSVLVSHILLHFARGETNVSLSNQPFHIRVGYNGNCTSSDECARGFRCIEMKCSCLDTDTYFDGQEGCKKKKQYNSSCEHDMQCFEGLVCKGSACVCKINNTNFVHTEKTYGCTHKKPLGFSCDVAEDCVDDLVCLNESCTCSLNDTSILCVQAKSTTVTSDQITQNNVGVGTILVTKASKENATWHYLSNLYTIKRASPTITISKPTTELPESSATTTKPSSVIAETTNLETTTNDATTNNRETEDGPVQQSTRRTPTIILSPSTSPSFTTISQEINVTANSSQAEEKMDYFRYVYIVSGALVLCLILVVAVIMSLRMKKQRAIKSRRKSFESVVSRHEYDYISEMKEAKSRQNSKIPVAEFSSYLKLASEYNMLENIFEEIKSSSPIYSSEIATKQRELFSDIQAYDRSRVILMKTYENESDYINASFIPGIESDREYIAAADPILSFGLFNFWRMVWEQDVQLIVTLCDENGKPRNGLCSKTSKWFGSLLVQEQSKSLFKTRMSREILIANDNGETKTVTEFQFFIRTSAKVMSATAEFVDFLMAVRSFREYLKKFNAPLLVHCSNGSGLTGVFIALDLLLRQVLSKNSIDIRDVVLSLSNNRPQMVRTLEQFRFIHNCLDKYLANLRSESLNNDHSYERLTNDREF
nr:receptor-type tyrosine-protein phosphatase H-like [Crassostrea gigas]